MTGTGRATLIGIIADTHGLLRPEAALQLAGADHIIHAGDVGRPEVIAGLRRIAPVTVIRGNVDMGVWAAALPERATVRLAGRTILVVHDANALNGTPPAGIDVVVSGHSHRPRIARADGVLYLNPGSAGPRRFRLPVSVATLEIAAGALDPRIHDLAV